MDVHRRRLLAVVTAGATALAGCGGGGDGDDEETPTDTAGATGTTTETAADTATGTETATETPESTDAATATETAAQTATETSTETATATATEAQLPRVELENTAFTPLRKSVTVGETVEWVNRDALPHNVRSAQFHDSAEDWSFETETFVTDESVTYTFEPAGIYEYYCSVHGQSNMCGAILVGDVDLDDSLPCK